MNPAEFMLGFTMVIYSLKDRSWEVDRIIVWLLASRQVDACRWMMGGQETFIHCILVPKLTTVVSYELTMHTYLAN
jgi:hypothetical protein